MNIKWNYPSWQISKQRCPHGWYMSEGLICVNIQTQSASSVYWQANEVNTTEENEYMTDHLTYPFDGGLKLLIGRQQHQHSKHGNALRPIMGLLKGFNTIPSTLFWPQASPK